MRKRLRIIAPLLALLLVAAPVALYAQDEADPTPGVFRSPSLEMTVRAGFNGLEVGYNGLWAPFRVSLINRGQPITGRLVVRSEASSGPNPTYREFVKDVQLPTGAQQLHEITAFVERGSDPVVRLVTGDRIVAEVAVSLGRGRGGQQKLNVVVVDGESSALSYLKGVAIERPTPREPFKTVANSAPPPRGGEAVLTTPAPPPPPGPGMPPNRSRSGQPPAAEVVVIPPEDLPRDYVSYAFADAVALGQAPLSQLSEEQARALRLWVASGGLLIVTGAADFAGMRALQLDALLPVEPQGAGAVADLPELTAVYGPFESSEPPLVMAGRLRPEAHALVGAGERPLIAEKRYGGGLVRFVGFNPKLNPYRAWSRAKDVWSDLLLTAAEGGPQMTNWVTANYGRRGVNVNSQLFRLAGVRPPSANYFIIFLLLYVLAIGPVNFFILRWKKKTDLAWLTIPAVVVAFTVVSLAVARITRGTQSLTSDISLVALHQGDGLARTYSGLMIMPAAKGTRDVTFAGRDAYARDLDGGVNASSSFAAEAVQTARGPQGARLRVPLNTWTPQAFELQSVGEGAAPLVRAAAPEPARVSVRNLGDAPLTKAVYLSAAGVSEVFDLQPGEERQLSLAAPQTLALQDWYRGQLPQDGFESEVFAALAPVLHGALGSSPGFVNLTNMPDALRRLERPVLLGFAERSSAAVEFGGSLRREGRTLYVIHL